MSIINSGICNPTYKSKINPINIKTLAGVHPCNIKVTIDPFLEFDTEEKLEFLEIKFHDKFDGLVGNNILMPLQAEISYKQRILKLRTGNEIPLYFNTEEEKEYQIPVPHEKLEIFQNEIFLSENDIRCNHLDPEIKAELMQTIRKFDKAFYHEGDDLSFTHEIKHKISTANEIPIYTKLYRYPQVHREEVNKQINDMLRQRIIRPSESPYSAPIWVVPKKQDASGKQKWRIVVDYRKLNNVTIDDKFPIPNIEDILDKLGRAMYFTTLDLAKGFYQIEVAEEDVKKTAFSTDSGHYEFVRMPFGLKNAPATFQRLMNAVLKDYIGKICYVYLDDIIIFSTSKEEHFDSLRKILKRLQDANLKIQLDKSEFLKQETEFLGHIVTTSGIKPNPLKTEAIHKFPIPKTPKQIKSFLGLVGFYRKFIKDFARIAKPMTICLKKDRRIDVNDPEYQAAFNKLKLLVTTDPILVYPDFKKKFVLTTDASNFAIGAVLSQDNRAVCYASRTLNEHEVKYSTIEKELLAIVWATKYFRPYLFGHKFTIRTDHKPLQWLHNLKEPNSKLQRWKIKLEEFNFDIEYLSGRENKVADALSRVEINVNEMEVDGTSSTGATVNSTNEDSSGNETEIDEISSTGATIHSANEDSSEHIPISESPLNFYKTQIIVERGSLIKKDSQKVFGRTRKIFTNPNPDENFFLNLLRAHFPPKGIVGLMINDTSTYTIFQNTYLKYFSKNKLLKLNKCHFLLEDITERHTLHEKILEQHYKTNHRGINDVYSELKTKIYFPKLKLEIQKVINNCHICNSAKYERKPLKLPFKLTETPSKPLEIIHMDIWFKCKGKPFLTFIDKFTKHAQVIPLKSRTWIDLKDGIMQYISSFGKPHKIITDQEKGFNSLNFVNFLESEGIQIHFTTPNNHTSNSDIERFHGTLNEHLRILNALEKEQRTPLDGDPVIKSVKIYNETIHSSTGKRPIDFLNGIISVEEYNSIHEKLLRNKKITIQKRNKGRHREKPSNYLKLNRITKLQPYHKRVNITESGEDHFKINTETHPRYINQFKRRMKYQN